MVKSTPTVRNHGFTNPKIEVVVLANSTAVLGKVEASPMPAPVEPYDPSLKIYQKKFPNYLPWHAHITCLTVAPAARRLGYATQLSKALEVAGDDDDAWFVDLFVRVENEAAIKLYKSMGYVLRRHSALTFLQPGRVTDTRLTDTRSIEESWITTTTGVMPSICESR